MSTSYMYLGHVSGGPWKSGGGGVYENYLGCEVGIVHLERGYFVKILLGGSR